MLHSLPGFELGVVEIPILCEEGHIRVARWNSANSCEKDGTTLLAIVVQSTDIEDIQERQGVGT
ncbi:MAG: hypothetical protein V1800_08940 [Candidatus Latescibacterota bacterium]